MSGSLQTLIRDLHRRRGRERRGLALAEGVRLVSQVLDLAPEQLRVGLPVEVVFDDVTPEVTLPKFRPLPQSAGV